MNIRETIERAAEWLDNMAGTLDKHDEALWMQEIHGAKLMATKLRAILAEPGVSVAELAELSQKVCEGRMTSFHALEAVRDRCLLGSAEMELRKALWLDHGCLGLYGDDGEMQCGACLLDFKRDTPERIIKRLHERGQIVPAEYQAVGCDPASGRVMEALQECGWEPQDSTERARVKALEQAVREVAEDLSGLVKALWSGKTRPTELRYQFFEETVAKLRAHLPPEPPAHDSLVFTSGEGT